MSFSLQILKKINLPFLIHFANSKKLYSLEKKYPKVFDKLRKEFVSYLDTVSVFANI